MTMRKVTTDKGTDASSRDMSTLTKTIHTFSKDTSQSTHNREATLSWGFHNREGSSKAFRCAFYVFGTEAEKSL